MVGLFYKNIQDPIEYGLLNEGQDTYYKPMNFGDAKNLGMEVDVMKYFNWFGIKANYTYTHSKVTTDKRIMEGSEVKSVRQSRPLFGQAAHVANLSLLFKETRHGWEGQVSASYTGKRLSDISNWYEDDIWEDGYAQLDASIEKVSRTVSVSLARPPTCWISRSCATFRKDRIRRVWIQTGIMGM